MELEFDVKMSSGILYNYMLHHTYSSLSGMIGTIVGALLITAAVLGNGFVYAIVGFVIIAYLPWTLFLRSKQQMLKTPAFKQPLHYKMTEEGVCVSQGEEVQMQEWEKMHKAVATGQSIILYTSPVNASIFPRKQLGDDIYAVIEMISTHMPPNKVKIRG